MKLQALCVLILQFSIFLKNANGEDYKVTEQIFFDIESEGSYIGRIVIGLFGDVAPKTVQNFKYIATNGISGKTYEGSKFHRVIKKSFLQGGDIISNNGSGSISIYGKFFDDENFVIKHDGPGLVSMANGGPNKNGCQFLITTIQTPWLNGIHTVFGKVIKGQGVVHKIEYMQTDTDDHPVNDIVIIRSGLIPTTPFYEPSQSYELSLWGWIKAGWFPLSFSMAILIFFQIIMMKLDSYKI